MIHEISTLYSFLCVGRCVRRAYLGHGGGEGDVVDAGHPGPRRRREHARGQLQRPRRLGPLPAGTSAEMQPCVRWSPVYPGVRGPASDWWEIFIPLVRRVVDFTSFDGHTSECMIQALEEGSLGASVFS